MNLLYYVVRDVVTFLGHPVCVWACVAFSTAGRFACSMICSCSVHSDDGNQCLPVHLPRPALCQVVCRRLESLWHCRQNKSLLMKASWSSVTVNLFISKSCRFYWCFGFVRAKMHY